MNEPGNTAAKTTSASERILRSDEKPLRLKLDRDILKKAAACVAKESE